jgi:hypothetical protein
MKPPELKFDSLSLWARVLNLPFHLRDKKWRLPIARQIDKHAKEVQFDHAGGYLRARVTVDVASPLRRWVSIESAQRKCMDLYEVQYEQAPHFCFSCGRFGHADLLCPTPGTRDANGDLPFGKGLRVPDEWKKSSYCEGSSGGQGSFQKNKADTRSSTSAAEKRPEVTSPQKKDNLNKRKAMHQSQVYRKVEFPRLENTPSIVGVAEGSLVLFKDESMNAACTETEVGGDEGRDPKKKKPTPTNSNNSAEAARQPCRDQ